MLDDTRLKSNLVSLLKLTTSEHGIYKSATFAYESLIHYCNVIQLLACQELTLAYDN